MMDAGTALIVCSITTLVGCTGAFVVGLTKLSPEKKQALNTGVCLLLNLLSLVIILVNPGSAY